MVEYWYFHIIKPNNFHHHPWTPDIFTYLCMGLDSFSKCPRHMISITLLLISVNDNSIVLSCSAKNPWVLCSSDNQQRIHLQILLIELQNISNADICRPLHKLAQGVTISHLAHAMFSKWYPCSLLAPYSSMGTLVKTQFWSCKFFAQNLWLRVKVLARLPSLCRDLAAVFSLDLTLNLSLSPIPGTLVPCSPGQASALGPLH